MDRSLVVEVELTNGERHPLTTKFDWTIGLEEDLKHLFDVNFNKEVISIVLDEIKRSLLETDLTIGDLKSIHFSICEKQEE